MHFPLDFIKLNLQLDIKQFLLHVLLVQAASPPPVQAASPSPLTSTLTPPVLEPSMAPMYVLLDLRPLPEILPLHLLGRPMPRGLSNSSTSMMVVLVRARTRGAQATTRFWTACRRCASTPPHKMIWLH